MNQNEIHELNRALKGEHMAIESFDHYIQDIDDSNMKKHFQDIQQQHKFHAIQIAERIQQLGGNPANTSGIGGIVAEVKHAVSPKKYIDGSILKSALEGEKIGLGGYDDIMSKVKDETNKKLLQEMLIDNVKIVEDLNKYMQ